MSVVVRRPLLSVVLRVLRRPVRHGSRRIALATAIIGVTLLVDAATRIILALHRLISWVIAGCGLALI